jgi:xylulokinase
MDRTASCLLGIDVGTSGAKALVIDPQGSVLAAVTTEYTFQTPRPGWTEQDPGVWWGATVASVRSALEKAGIGGSHIAAIGLTGQMHGLVLLDESGQPVRPCIMWNDQRTATECEEIHRRIGRDEIIQITGKPALPNFTAPKILWVRRHEPDAYRRAAHLLLPKDYVRYRLTGEFCSDVADASGTSLLDVGVRRWSDRMIDALEVPRAWLPSILESPDISGSLSRQAASDTGLLEGAPVIAGAGDQAAEAVGLGIINQGDVSVTIGTSGVVFVSFNEYRVDVAGKLHAYCHAAPEKWHIMGVMLSAGGSLRWYRDAVCQAETSRAAETGIDAYDLISAEAAAIAPGCEGLFFLPYLSGERTPHADPNARGAFIGLSLRHRKAHMTRAIIEGVTFGLMDSLQLVRQMGLTVKAVRVSGGGSKNALWRQMMADVFDAEVITVNAMQGAAFGAALLASVGAGFYSRIDDACKAVIRETGHTLPGAARSIYPAYYEKFRSLYQSLREEFKAIASIVESPG